MPHDGKSRRVSIETLRMNEQLGRILSSSEFGGLDRGRSLLEYVIRQALAGNLHNLEVSAVARSVFGRDRPYDEKVDPIVRIETNRVRRALDLYYAGAGNCEVLRIAIASTGCTPIFIWHMPPGLTIEGSSQNEKLSSGPSVETSQQGPEDSITYRDLLLPIGVPLALIVMIALALLKPVRTLFY
jgi:hypothetical protein